MRASKVAELTSLTFTPVTIVERTNGYDNGDYWHYDEWYLLYESTYKATFTDGTVSTGSSSGLYYDDEWYSFNYSSDQSAENPWTAGNTYVVTVTVQGKTAEIPVTIVESPLQSISFTPVTVPAGINSDYNDGYWEYSAWSLLYNSTYTATFADGTVLTGRDGGLTYGGVRYSFGYSSDQSPENPWTVGNTYAVTVTIMGQTAEIPVTITEPLLQSISFAPITIVEGMCADYDSYEGCWRYSIWDLLYYRSTHTATFADGTVLDGSGHGLTYNGSWHSFACSSDQSSENPWLPGNTYTFTAAILGQVVEVPVTILENPIVNITAEPLCMREYDGGHWYGTRGYYYEWLDKVC